MATRRAPRRLFLAWLTLAALAAPAARSDDPTSTMTTPATRSVDPSIATLVAALDDRDPAERDRAAEALVARGRDTRAAVLAATRSPRPQTAARAQQVLLALPWDEPADPPPVRAALREYGKLDTAGRIGVVAKLTEMPRDVAADALLRLLFEDPNEDVAWQIVTLLRRNPDRPTLDRVRSLDISQARVAARVLVGMARLNTDRASALAILRGAVERAAAAPTRVGRDDGEMDLAFRVVVTRAVHDGNYDDAARLLRMQANLTGGDGEIGSAMSAALALFALQAKHGPIEGFVDDAERFSRFAELPQARYAMGRAFDRAGARLAAAACYAAAFGEAGPTGGTPKPYDRLRTADFLIDQGWGDLADREFAAVLAAPRDDELPIAQINARLRMALAAQRAEEHAAAAEHLEAALALIGDREKQLRRTNRRAREAAGFDAAPVKAQAHWHRFRAAEQAGDAAAAAWHLEQFLAADEPGAAGGEAVLDVVPHLVRNGRQPEADALFEKAYAPIRQRVDREGDRVAAQSLNELAWLCARSGHRPQEAYELASRAVAMEPDNAAFLDTKAEAAFRLGKRDEAVQLETRALKLEPGDAFMAKQLERFRTQTP